MVTVIDAVTRGRNARFVVCGFLLCASAFAQTPDQPPTAVPMFLPAPSQTFYLDLDSPAGVFSMWRHDSLGPLTALQAVLRVPRFRKDGRWRPTFTIYLQGNDDPSVADELGLQLFTLNGKLPLETRLAGRLHGKPIQEIPLQTRIGVNEELKVEIRWGSPQLITFMIGSTETSSVQISWPIRRALIAASTGELKVDPLVLGTVKP